MSPRQERVESVYLSYLPAEDNEGGSSNNNGSLETVATTKIVGSSSPPTPSVTVTAPLPPLTRPLNLGIATAAANNAAREQAQQQQQQQTRVQQKLQQQRTGAGGASPLKTNFPPSSIPSASPSQSARSSPPHQARASPFSSNSASPTPLSLQHVIPPQQRGQQQQQQQQQMRIGNGGGNPAPSHQQQQQQPQMRPLQLRANPAQMPHQQQQQQLQQPMRSGRQGPLPALKVTVPEPVHQNPLNQPQPQPQIHHQYQQQQSQRQQRQQQNSPPSPFSSSVETLVGSPLNPNKNKYNNNNNTKPANWSPSSSSGSSSTAHGHNNIQHQPSGPYSHGQVYRQQQPPPSPSIKNLQLQIPRDRMADPENDRLSPAMPGQSNTNNQKDFWKRFSTVVRENEKSQQLAEKTGGKSSKTESEWLDKQRHRMRSYRIWVGVVAFIILAAIGGGLAYHFVTKEDSDNNVQPTTHDVSPGDKKTTSYIPTVSSSMAPVTMAQPSAVPAGNVIGSSSRAKRDEGADVGAPEVYMPLLTQPASNGHVGARSLDSHAQAQAHVLRRRRLSDLN